MIRETIHALAACLVTFVLCAVAYPATVWGLGQVAFPDQAEGSLIRNREREVVGSSLLAQPFASDKYFSPRPSAVDYNASATGGSNLGTTNPDLKKNIGERAEALKASADAPAPVDLVTASGGGLDPHISPDAARFQAARVALARNLTGERVRELIERHTDRSGAIIGAPPRVNVLLLNVALDDEKPTPSSAVVAAPPSTATEPAPAVETPKPAQAPAAAATEARPPTAEVEALAARVDQLQAKLDAAPVARLADDLKDVKVRLASLVESPANPAELAKKLDDASGRLAASDREIEALKGEIKALRTSNAGAEGLPELDRKIVALRQEFETLRKPSTAPAASQANFDAARSLFRARKYAEAAEAFRAITESHADDARGWYLAAVSRGLATRQWRGEVEQMAMKGVEREKAGTPGPVEINEACAELTAETGRNWLAFFRKRTSNP